MARHELNVELLLNRRVYGADGKPVGRLEEVRVEPRGGELFVIEYLVGTYAFMERLARGAVGRAVLHTFGAARKGEGYRVPWDQLDLADPQRPALRCSTSALALITPGREARGK